MSNVGDVVVLDGRTGYRLQSPPQSTLSAWTLAVDVTQDDGSRGYIVAMTGEDGADRYFTLYSTSNRITCYYMRNGERASLHFRTGINDGVRHRVTLTVAATTASLLIDDSEPVNLRLPDIMQACPNSCVVTIGHRANGGSGSYFFSGTIHAAAVVTNRALPVHPAIDFGFRGSYPPIDGSGGGDDGVRVHDWLPGTGVSFFRGVADSVVLVDGHDYLAATRFTVAIKIAMRQTGTTSGSYIFAKSNAAGARFYSLYAGTDGTVRMYYRVGTSTTIRRVTFDYSLNDGRLYRVLLSVDGEAASLFVDDVRIGDPQTLAGPIGDCGASTDDCVLYLGQRASPQGGAYRLLGAIHDARFINGAALTLYPERAT